MIETMENVMENTAGAIMTPEFVRLRANMRADDAIRAVRVSGLDLSLIHI